MARILAEYIWLGPEREKQELTETAQRPRSKARVLAEVPNDIKDVPVWRFDGSSTGQASGNASDLLLKPVCMTPDPLRGEENILVLCTVLNPDGSPHSHNTRHWAADATQRFVRYEPWLGFEQEFTLFNLNGLPLCANATDNTLPPQFKQYCSVGADRAFGRAIIEEHTRLCLAAGLSIAGINGEVMGGQWEFQIGPIVGEEEPKSALDTCDDLWLARWLLHRVAEKHGVVASFDPKPVASHNGAGCHTNFSTKLTRTPGGIKAIRSAIAKLEPRHNLHMQVYGDGNEARLTGKHETASFERFTYGVADRGASIRIGADVEAAGKGYFEVRSPAANCDPYLVLTALLETVCGKGFQPRT